MKRIEQTVFIRAPVDQVFGIASDWQRWEEWFVGVKGFRPTTETTRGNGTRYAYTATMLGIPAKVETEITEFRENEGWVGVATKGVYHRSIWSFSETSDGTKFTYALEYRLPPVIGALLEPLLKREWRHIINESVLNLEQLVTAEAR
jgi:carbon monoxide dehydrogenase subunit G